MAKRGLPWRRIGLFQWSVYHISLTILAPLMLGLCRVRWSGRDKVPRDGAFLLLSNHTSVLDPVWGAWPLWRPVRFMASVQLFRFKLLGPIIRALGAFPKKKFVKDRGSMQTLATFFEKGLPVMLFPEGDRSFDGRPGRILPGIGRLTKRLDADLVFVRNLTGHLFQPRWARYPRFVPIVLEFDGPHTFEEGASVEEITDFVIDRLAIEADRPAPPRSWGWRMAHGLEQYLWACPHCFEVDSLSPSPRNGNVVACSRCGAHWRLDVSCRLSGIDGAPDTDVWRAHDAIEAHFGSPPVIDQERFESDGVILEELGEIGEMRRSADPRELGSGWLQLRTDRVSLSSPDGKTEHWSLPLDEIVAVSLEVGNKLQLRTPDALYQIHPVQGAPAKWMHFLRPRCPKLQQN